MEVVEVFTNIIPTPIPDNNKLKEFINGQAMNIGAGALAFKVDGSGMWLGANKFADAPFRVDMAGNAVINSIVITGGEISYGKTSFTDTINSGYYIGPSGIFFGNAGNSVRLKFTVATGAFDLTGITLTWSSITGTGKPANNATVGAQFGVNITGGSTGTNYVDNNGYITTITGSSITTGTLNASLCNVTNINADNINTGTITVNSSAVGILVNSGGDVVFECDSYSTFSSITFTRKSYTNYGWDIFFTPTGGGGWQAGDLMIFPQSNNASDTVRFGNSSQTCNIIVHGSISSGNIISDQINADAVIPNTARSYSLGSSSYMWQNVYTDALQLSKSGYTTKYIVLNTSNNFEMNSGLYVGGTLSKSAGSFKIDHPLKPKTHWLQHSFVESPDMLNLYAGTAEIKDGEAIVEMPDWFIPLNGRNDTYTYQLTSIGQENSLWVKRGVNKKGVIIFGGAKDGSFSYIITGIRHDKYARKNRIEIEVKK